MMATLAPNLDRARTAIHDAWSWLIVYWIGDAAHAASRSDHNPDARGIVHAIDVMAAAGTEQAAAVVRAATGRPDLEYVIHDRQIWSRNSGWVARGYDGDNPHTDHVHISGRHGTVGATQYTESGYDTTAEQDTTPWVLALSETTGGDMSQPFAADNADAYGYALTQRHKDLQVHAAGTDPGLTTIPNRLELLFAKLEHFLENPPAAPVVTLTDADMDRLAQKVAALLPPLTAAPSVADIAQGLATRLGNG